MTPRVHPHTPRVAAACNCELAEEATWDAWSGPLIWVGVLPVPTALVTRCTFDGPARTALFITTGLHGRDPPLDSMAAHLFAVETEVAGLPGAIRGPARTL